MDNHVWSGRTLKAYLWLKEAYNLFYVDAYFYVDIFLCKSISLRRSKQYILHISNNTENAVAYVRLIARNTTARFYFLSSTPFHAIDHACITLVQQL